MQCEQFRKDGGCGPGRRWAERGREELFGVNKRNGRNIHRIDQKENRRKGSWTERCLERSLWAISGWKGNGWLAASAVEAESCRREAGMLVTPVEGRRIRKKKVRRRERRWEEEKENRREEKKKKKKQLITTTYYCYCEVVHLGASHQIHRRGLLYYTVW